MLPKRLIKSTVAMMVGCQYRVPLVVRREGPEDVDWSFAPSLFLGA